MCTQVPRGRPQSDVREWLMYPPILLLDPLACADAGVDADDAAAVAFCTSCSESSLLLLLVSTVNRTCAHTCRGKVTQYQHAMVS